MMTLREKAFFNLAMAQRMTVLGHHALAQIHYRSAGRQFRQLNAQMDEDDRQLRADNRRAAALQAKRAAEVPF